MSVKKLKVVLCWHMHQPDYRGPEGADYKLPWVYLHGTKDYVDMAYHLESIPKARAVVNFAPVLLEQLDDYVTQIGNWIEHGTRIRDPLLAALAGPGLPLEGTSRKQVLQAVLKANERNLIGRFPPYQRLAELARQLLAEPLLQPYFSDRLLVDLLVWYHLAWMGEEVREKEPRIGKLEEKGGGFDASDRHALLEIIYTTLKGIIPRYRALAEAGKVELSVSPYAHPIIPLLLDLGSAREAMPKVALPKESGYPGGEERSRWHLRKGLEVFEQHFGFRPSGCWPSEGAISDATLRLLEAEGFTWAASGQAVLSNSLHASLAGAAFPPHWSHRPYRLEEGKLNSFFRDDGLSDLIGFTYSDWHGDDAVGNLVQHLETIACATDCDDNCVVSIILDGENAWEHYPKNGWYFLQALYQRLSTHPQLDLTTFEAAMQKSLDQVATLPQLVGGSWVYGTFSTWIGDRDKNRAWEMLIEAKHHYDRVVRQHRLDPKRLAEAELQLAHCEGSDWFWWFGDYNPAAAVADFEQLFRAQLTCLYQLLEVKPPAYLGKVFAEGKGDPAKGGVMRKS